jgi:hypothetical protein
VLDLGRYVRAARRRGDRRYERRCSALRVQVVCVSLKICSAICTGLFSPLLRHPQRKPLYRPWRKAPRVRLLLEYRARPPTPQDFGVRLRRTAKCSVPQAGYEPIRFPYAFLTQVSNVRKFDRSASKALDEIWFVPVVMQAHAIG